MENVRNVWKREWEDILTPAIRNSILPIENQRSKSKRAVLVLVIVNQAQYTIWDRNRFSSTFHMPSLHLIIFNFGPFNSFGSFNFCLSTAALPLATFAYSMENCKQAYDRAILHLLECVWFWYSLSKYVLFFFVFSSLLLFHFRLSTAHILFHWRIILLNFSPHHRYFTRSK